MDNKRTVLMFGIRGPNPNCFGCDHERVNPMPSECNGCYFTGVFARGSNYYKKTEDKPPLGLKPRWLMLEHRNREIIEAMHRKADDCMDKAEPIIIDPLWIMELLENNKELIARNEVANRE